MTNKQRLMILKYKDLEKEELEKTISQFVKIREQILEDSNILELCEYLNKLEEIFGEIEGCRIMY